MEAVIEDVPEYKALWFLNAYDQELYDYLLLADHLNQRQSG